MPGEDLLKTVELLSIPEGELYTWVATESYIVMEEVKESLNLPIAD